MLLFQNQSRSSHKIQSQTTKTNQINEQKIIYNVQHSKCSKKSTFFITNFPSPIFRLIGLPMTRPQKSDRSRVHIPKMKKFVNFHLHRMGNIPKRKIRSNPRPDLRKRTLKTGSQKRTSLFKADNFETWYDNPDATSPSIASAQEPSIADHILHFHFKHPHITHSRDILHFRKEQIFFITPLASQWRVRKNLIGPDSKFARFQNFPVFSMNRWRQNARNETNLIGPRSKFQREKNLRFFTCIR